MTSVLRLLIFIVCLSPAVRAQTFFEKVGKAVGNTVSQVGQAGSAAINGVGHFAGQVVTTAGQGVGTVVGAVSPQAGNAIKDGAKRLGNNIEQGSSVVGAGVEHVVHEVGNQIEENPVGVLIAILCPPAAPFVLGAPTVLQALTCTISERFKAKETCDVNGTLSSLSVAPVATLGEIDMDIAPLTTLFKCMGIEGWLDTGCEAVGSGRPVREAQHSNDGFWTIDVALDDFQIRQKHASQNRFIRLEIRPNRPAHSTASQHLFTAADHICFGGPVLIDKGKWLEVHPIADFGSCPETSTAGAMPEVPETSASETRREEQAKNAGEMKSDVHIVSKGECLAKIAEEYYGKQLWPRIFKANRKIIRNPDLVYPGQQLQIPSV